MKTLNTIFIISLLLGGVALIAMAIIFKAYIHILFGVAFLLLSAAWRREAKAL